MYYAQVANEFVAAVKASRPSVLNQNRGIQESGACILNKSSAFLVFAQYTNMTKLIATILVSKSPNLKEYFLQKLLSNIGFAFNGYVSQPEALTRVCLTNRFHDAVRLFSNRSQMTSKCGENTKLSHKPLSVSLMFLPYFDVIRDLSLNRFSATWNLFVFKQ